MRTVSVHVVRDAQEKITLRPESIVGRQGTHAGPLMAGRPFVSRGLKHPGTLSAAFLALSPATPLTLFAKLKEFRHGDSRNTNESIHSDHPVHPDPPPVSDPAG